MTYWQMNAGATPDQEFRARQAARAAYRKMLAEEEERRRRQLIDDILFAITFALLFFAMGFWMAM